MKISEAIAYVDTNRPNAFNDDTKVAWLSELDARIAGDIMLMSAADLQQFNYDPEDDLETELLVNFPHDKMYMQYLMARLDEANGEYNRYANSSVLFNASYSNFVNWFLTSYDPVQGCDAQLEEY